MTEPNTRSGIGILNLQGSSQGGSQITYPYLQNVLSRVNLDAFTGKLVRVSRTKMHNFMQSLVPPLNS